MVLPIQSPTICSALEPLIYQIRDPQTNADSFRKALETIGRYLALIVRDQLPTKQVTIQTLTGAKATHQRLQESPVLVTILRAGLPLNNGIQKVFPNAPVGFLAMSRDEKTLKPKTDYIALPSLKGRCVILSDTMLATGGSLLDAIQRIQQEKPEKIFVIAAIASQKGLEKIREKHPEISVITAVVDPLLNSKGFIVPGLGDAGDRCFGPKAVHG